MASESITDELERRLAAAEAALRLVPALLWQADARGSQFSFNQPWLDYTGQTLEATQNNGWMEAIHPEDRSNSMRAFRRAVRMGAALEIEHRLRGADGYYRWFAVRHHPLREAGRVCAWFGAAIDIDDRKRAAQALRETQESYRIELEQQVQERTAELRSSLDLLQATMDSSRDMVQVFEAVRDDTGEIVDFRWLFNNHTAEKLYGDVIGRSLLQNNPGVAEEGIFDTFKRVVETGEPDQSEHHYVHEQFDGWFHQSCVKLGDGVATTTSDITERKLAEVDVLRLQEEVAQAALHESEERFRQFANASSDALWIRDAGTLEMEYVSPAIATIYGVAPGTLMGDVKSWAALIVPEDRRTALAHLEKARQGTAVVHDFRIQRPSDRLFRWIRNTDFPLLDELGRVQRIGGIAKDVTETKLAVEHQTVLLAELQHRVRNIMAIIRSITARTGERAESVPEYAAVMNGRLLTLARVQVLLTRAANIGVGIETVVSNEVHAQAHHPSQYDVSGPNVILSPKAAEVLTLAVHELTTNALKYGALADPNGKIAVRWNTSEKRGANWLTFEWVEENPPGRPVSQPIRRGFGSELVEERLPYELDGRGKLTFEPQGVRCQIEFPLKEGASILGTNAPQRARVFGGALDMTGEADLSGQRVLVLEDDYYLATDTARALRGAGATVLGPCANEQTAEDAIKDTVPTGAVLDINLGRGPSFKLARALRERSIRFVFLTGYDEDVIPDEFEGVVRLQKPVELRQIVNTLAQALHDGADQHG